MQDVITLVSFKKCMAGLNEYYKTMIDKQANAIFEGTIVRKLPTFFKKLAEAFPSHKEFILDQTIKCFPHKDKPSIVAMLVYQRFAFKLAAMLSTHLCPDAEQKVYKQVIDLIAGLDVDINIKMRKGSALAKTNNPQQQDLKVAMNNIFQKC